MNGSNRRWRPPGRRPWAMMAGALLAAGLAAACSSGGSSSTGSSAATSAGTSASASSAAGGGSGAAAASACGTTVPVGPSNPSGVYASMPANLKSIYSSYPDELIQSPWATTKITAKPPWKIGFIAFAITNPYNQDVLTGLQQQFAKAKSGRPGDGQPDHEHPGDHGRLHGGAADLRDPADGVAGRERDHPAAGGQRRRGPGHQRRGQGGRAGHPGRHSARRPNTPYAVSAWSQNQVEADAGALGLIKKGNIIMVKGIAGNENDVVLYNQAIADLKNCPNIHVAATLYGNWDEGTAKTVVAQYIASHPQPLAGAIQDGGMMSGVIQAFEATGAKVPVIADGECGGGDLSWWLAHKATYQTVAGCFNGFQGAYTYMDVTLRVLDNKGPKYNVLEMPTPAITNANLAQFAKPGLPLSSTEEVGGPQTAWCDDTCLDKYFTVTGAATAS